MLNVCRLKILMVITFINFMLLGNTDSDTKLRENYLNSSYMLLGKSIIYDLLTLRHEINKINIIIKTEKNYFLLVSNLFK
mgnify:CR=1 FL=1